MPRCKIPTSVLVILHDPDFWILLLERADRPGFWQSVTGSLEQEGEPLLAAAQREVLEETGLQVADSAWQDWQFAQQYEIFPHWRHRYAPGVTHNTEYLFSVEIRRDVSLQLSPREHLRYRWLPWQEAADACFSWTNALAIHKLARARGASAARDLTAGPGSGSPPTDVTYQAGDKILLLGPSARARPLCTVAKRLTKIGSPVLLLTVDHPAPPVERSAPASADAALPVTARPADALTECVGLPVLYAHPSSLQLEGVLGDYRLTLDEPPDPADSLSFSTQRQRSSRHYVFDQVLDLGTQPLLQAEWLPLGYHAPDPQDSAALEPAMDALSRLQGHFTKPRFVAYDPSLCAHGWQGIPGCTRCLEVCPALAIRSLGNQIEVQAERCQGGGSCVGVCPTGALTDLYPQPDHAWQTIQAALRLYRTVVRTGPAPLLLIHAAGVGAATVATLQASAPRPATLLVVEVEELGRLGMDVLLRALALGAGGILLLDTDEVTPRIRRALQAELACAQALLTGLGYPAAALRLQSVTGWPTLLPDWPWALETLPDLSGPEESTAAPSGHEPPATVPAPSLLSPRVPAATPQTDDPPTLLPLPPERRRQLLQALDALRDQRTREASLPLLQPLPIQIALPAGAPFGTLHVDRQRCTLCMACVGSCPTEALYSQEDPLGLFFLETHCVQCGLCVHTCPEQAITQQARWVVETLPRQTGRLLHEEELLPCPGCGQPSISRNLLRRMQQRLEQHPGRLGQGAQRTLQLCETCRDRELFP